MTQQSAIETSVEHTSIGRIVVPPHVPDGFRLFYTTIDFPGPITKELRDFVGVPLASCHQVHGASVRTGFSRSPSDRLKPVLTPEPECDALWTDQKNVALAIKVADCLPVTLIDTRNHLLANIHSGWRGAVQRITEKTLDVVPLDPSHTIAWLGPAIRLCCFEVGEEVASQFDERWVDRTIGPKPHVDTVALTADVLRARGIGQVIDTGLCTRCEGSIFHSYRRDRQSGRNLAIVAQ